MFQSLFRVNKVINSPKRPKEGIVSSGRARAGMDGSGERVLAVATRVSGCAEGEKRYRRSFVRSFALANRTDQNDEGGSQAVASLASIPDANEEGERERESGNS